MQPTSKVEHTAAGEMAVVERLATLDALDAAVPIVVVALQVAEQLVTGVQAGTAVSPVQPTAAGKGVRLAVEAVRGPVTLRDVPSGPRPPLAEVAR